jgi:hypothetical protein
MGRYPYSRERRPRLTLRIPGLMANDEEQRSTVREKKGGGAERSIGSCLPNERVLPGGEASIAARSARDRLQG